MYFSKLREPWSFQQGKPCFAGVVLVQKIALCTKVNVHR